MKLLKWMLVALVSCVLCVVCVYLVRKAVTPSRPAAPLVAQGSSPGETRIPIETVAKSMQVSTPTPSPTPVIPATPIGNLPAPSLVKAAAEAAKPRPVASPTVAAAVTTTSAPHMVYDPAVEKAQKLLAQLGYDVGRPDGKLGPRTRNALLAFQRDHALARSGKADDATLAKLDEEAKRAAVARLAKATPAPTASPKLSSGSTTTTTAAAPPRRLGEPQVLVVKGAGGKTDFSKVPALDNKRDVSRLQKALADAGYYKGEIDGRWGKESLAALRAFQKSLGLHPSTRIDSDTWEKLVTAAGPTPTPLPDLLVVAPVSKTLKKAKLPEQLVWYTPTPEGLAPTPTNQKATAEAPAEKRTTPAGEITKVAAEANAPAPQAVSAEATPKVKPAATPPAAAQPSDVAAPRHLPASTTSPAEDVVPTPAPVGSSLNIASAKGIELAPPDRSQSGAVPVLLPQSPGQRTSGTYAEPVGARVETVAHENVSVQTLAERAATASTATTTSPVVSAVSLSESLQAAAQVLEKSQPKSKREEAQEKVQAVEQAYNELKKQWAGKFPSGAVADQIQAVENGFKTMKADFNKGEYNRILERGDGFRRAIEIVAAHAYVASMLSKSEVRAKLPKADLQAIETLRREAERYPERLEKQEKFLDAAALIRAKAGNAATNSSSKNGNKSSATKSNGAAAQRNGTKKTGSRSSRS